MCDHRSGEAPEPTCLAAFPYNGRVLPLPAPSQELPQLPTTFCSSTTCQAGPGRLPLQAFTAASWARKLIARTPGPSCRVAMREQTWVRSRASGERCPRTLQKLPKVRYQRPTVHTLLLYFRSYLPMGAIMLNRKKKKKKKLSAQWSDCIFNRSLRYNEEQ